MAKILNIDLELVVSDTMSEPDTMRLMAEIYEAIENFGFEVDSHSYGFREKKV